MLFLNPIAWVLLGVPQILLALMAVGLLGPEVGKFTEAIWPAVSMKFMPPVITGFVAIAIFAVAMSTADGQQIPTFVQSAVVDQYSDPTKIVVPEDATGPALEHGQMASATGFRYVRAWAAEFAEFIAAIREDRDPAVSGEDGVRVLEITDAVFQSGRSGQAVDV